jgi:hypothetical protein
MPPELLLETYHRFRGEYPDIPLPDDVNKEDLGDFFVTLPIGKFNARSRNKRTYGEKAVRKLVSEVNEKRPTGHWGHPDPKDRSERPPVVQWLAATVDEKSGTAWGKLIPLTTEAKDYLRVKRATRSEVGNSLYGDAVMEGDKVVDLTLEYIDLVADSRIVGVPDTAAVPVTTKETIQKEGKKMPTEFNETTLITELREERETARKNVSELEKKVAELQPAASQFDALKKFVTEQADVFTSAGITISANGPDFIQVIREMIGKLQGLQAEKLAGQLDGVVTEMVKVEKLRPIVRQLLGAPKSEADARARVTEILGQESMKELAQAIVREQAGPNAYVPGGDGKTRETSEDVDKKAKAAAAARGV